MSLVREAVREGRLEEVSMWKSLVLIHKKGGGYHVIGLVEVVWKVVAVINNCQTTASITFHNVLHGFRAGCRPGTATLEAKLCQQLVAMR